MSERTVEVARQRLNVRGRSPLRLIEDRLLRFPRLVAFLIRRAEHLHPRSRLRRILTRRAIQTGAEALNRGEPERLFGIYHPNDSELVVGDRFKGLAMEGARGREARIRFQEAWNAEWGEFRFEPEELIDFGGSRVLVMGRIKGSGRTSGAAFDGEWAALMTFAGGWVVREEVFFDHAEGLEAAGVDTWSAQGLTQRPSDVREA